MPRGMNKIDVMLLEKYRAVWEKEWFSRGEDYDPRKIAREMGASMGASMAACAHYHRIAYGTSRSRWISEQKAKKGKAAKAPKLINPNGSSKGGWDKVTFLPKSYRPKVTRAERKAAKAENYLGGDIYVSRPKGAAQ
ncbi:MAG: hypothetical protein KDB79_17050 [Acidobacteria bacterium]|nr:hypothetical protein [Acidobacteriota bacterium]